jgi:hypothetical protein
MGSPRKPLFISSPEGFHEEMDPSDSMTLGGLTMGGNIAMAAHKVTGLAAGTASGDALAWGQGGVQLGSTTFTDDVSLGDNQITNVNAPVNPGDAANKAYVDAIASGLTVHDHCQAMADANVVLTSNYPATIDGYTVVAEDRILLTGQTNDIQNGIYRADTSTHKFVRVDDLTTGDHASGAYTFIQFGGSYGGTGWTCTAVNPTDVVDTDSLPWGQFSSTGHITAGDGISITTGVVAVNLATNPGLMFDNSTPTKKLEAKPDTARGLDKDGSGLFVKVDNSTIGFGSGGNAGKLVVLGAGQASAVENDIPLTAGGSVDVGDPVYIDGSNTVDQSDAANDTKSRVIGVALLAQPTPGSPVKVISAGIAAGVLSGATPGTPYYLATGGGLATSLPPGQSKRVIQVGMAKNATDLYVRIMDYGKKAAA